MSEGVAKLPDNVDLRVILADLKLSTGDTGAARKLLDEIVQLEPKVLAHRQRLARFFLLNKDPAAAETALRDAVKAVPDDVAMKLSLVELIGSQVAPTRRKRRCWSS